MNSSPIENILKKDRLIIITGLFIICLLSWLYIIYLYKQMYPMNMDAMFFAMPMSAKWTATDFILLFLMWIVMMIAMMVPSVAPLILIFAGINRKRRLAQSPYVPAIYLLTGYFGIWLIFSLFATVLQWWMQQLSLLNPDMIITNKIAGGIILIAAGLFQFTTLKQKCLYNCQTPIQFIHKHWREGKAGAFRMGVKNGLFCLGCCWILMILLFVSGIMNLLWIAIIAAFVFVEKISAQKKLISYISGAALIIYGVFVLVNK